jgi:hypothetical protein
MTWKDLHLIRCMQSSGYEAHPILGLSLETRAGLVMGG